MFCYKEKSEKGFKQMLEQSFKWRTNEGINESGVKCGKDWMKAEIKMCVLTAKLTRMMPPALLLLFYLGQRLTHTCTNTQDLICSVSHSWHANFSHFCSEHQEKNIYESVMLVFKRLRDLSATCVRTVSEGRVFNSAQVCTYEARSVQAKQLCRFLISDLLQPLMAKSTWSQQLLNAQAAFKDRKVDSLHTKACVCECECVDWWHTFSSSSSSSLPDRGVFEVSFLFLYFLYIH